MTSCSLLITFYLLFCRSSDEVFYKFNIETKKSSHNVFVYYKLNHFNYFCEKYQEHICDECNPSGTSGDSAKIGLKIA
ncbi:CLUMA_CG020721, isoform A [Clunio marinus]|uniref:CLUMA_CG020721, isoform A n=1 Tax=Clunio marinus TaxID=568069 RepID=A0A1J1J5U5_9DIPT|nr:CLUMA_CG020721, isoform A [Clunio marinus]